MKTALENGITGGFLSHTLLICGETEMTIANAKKTLCKRTRLRRGGRRHRKRKDVCVYRHTKPFHGAECRVKRKITAY